jgi:hypothetical protein
LLAWLALPALAAAGDLRLAVRETVTLEFPQVSAAFAVDSDIVEVTAVGSQVTLVGRRAGKTLVTVVMPTIVETLTVHVEALPARSVAFETSATHSAGSWEASYDSATRRFGTGLTMAFGEGERTARLALYGIRESGLAGRDSIWALPAASMELKEPGRSVVLLDERVNTSPLTLNGAVLRGLHLREGAFEMHAGLSSRTPWNDLLLPRSGDRALGLSYRSDAGPVRLVPGLLWLPDSGAKVPGVVSLGLERGSSDTPVRLKAELGWSDKPGIAFDLALSNAQRQVWLQGASRPASFAALDVARPAGTYLDGAWSERFGERTTAGLTLSANRLDLTNQRPEAASGRLELRHQATDHWSVIAGMGEGGYRNAGTTSLRRSTISLGTAYDTPAFGIASLYRYQQTSAASSGGHGGRVTMRGTSGAWRTNLFVDAQQQAPTLDLVFRDRPDLARAFAELGIVASTPEDVVRLLRENAALLAAHGVAVGPLNVDALRLQAGSDISWRESGHGNLTLELRMLADERHGLGGGSRSYLGSLYASWRIFRDTELAVSLVRWSSQRDGSTSSIDNSVQVTLRTGLSGNGLAALGRGGVGLRPISGGVLRDDQATGLPDVDQQPLDGIEVVLDGWRRTRTDRDGRFVFDTPGSGDHRVEAVLPPNPGAYFTTLSAVTLPPGGDARFAITFSAARLNGTVRSDAGRPLAGVTLRLAGVKGVTATTDSDGAYRFAVPAGEAQVSLVAESIPAGYELGNLDPQTRHLAPGAPAVANFTVRAQRMLKGVVGGMGNEPVTVTAVEIARTVSPDKSGHFLLRGLPAGSLTLVVGSRFGETRQVVEIPAEPGPVTKIELAAPCAASAPKGASTDRCTRSAVDRVH